MSQNVLICYELLQMVVLTLYNANELHKY